MASQGKGSPNNQRGPNPVYQQRGYQRPGGMNGYSTSLKTHSFKLVLLGEAAVGKSSLLMQLADKRFNENQETTIGAAYRDKTITLDEKSIRLGIWDTAGQERFESLAPMYYRGAQGAIIVYDITQEKSFNRAQKWVRELQRYAESDTVIALAGNKKDLEHMRTVQYQDALNYAEDNNLIFMETSAKKGSNVEELFTNLARRLPGATDTEEVIKIDKKKKGDKGNTKCGCS